MKITIVNFSDFQISIWKGHTDTYSIQSMNKVVLLKDTWHLSEEQSRSWIELSMSVRLSVHIIMETSKYLKIDYGCFHD